LARPKQLRRTDAEHLSSFLEGAGATRFGSWRVGAVELIRSELSPQGSHYTTLDVCPL
jgi:2'-5' RNA ligase